MSLRATDLIDYIFDWLHHFSIAIQEVHFLLWTHVSLLPQDARRERDSVQLALAKLEKALDGTLIDLSSSKAEVNDFMVEVEMTGQAFEDMQGQNARLVTQLAERDEQLQMLQSNVVKVRESTQCRRVLYATSHEEAL